MGANVIESVATAVIAGQLPAPVQFGQWLMREREFVVVRVCSTSGHTGWSFTLTRDGAIRSQIERSVASSYLGASVDDPERCFRKTLRSNLACHSNGVGLRALSVVDLAMWDLSARAADRSIAEHLGGGLQPMPATAIVGYPPATMDGNDVAVQVAQLANRGWKRFKLPVAADHDATVARLRAARLAAGDSAWVGCDGAWLFDDVDEAVRLATDVADLRLGWLEDLFPPGEIEPLVEMRSKVEVPIAMGDEQGGAYYPDALIDRQAVDLIRIDLTCMGGISGGRTVVDKCLRANMPFAAHMFAHVHSQVFSAWGFSDVPIEWGVPWTGVDPFADSLVQPKLDHLGRMLPLTDEPGFGTLVNREWALSQPHDDPDRILDE